MTGAQNPFTIILLIGATQAVILGIQLFFKKGNRLANLYLSTILFLLASAIGIHTVSHLLDRFYEGHQVLISILLVLLSPFIYLYTSALMDPSYSLKRKHLAFFIPFLLTLFLGIAQHTRLNLWMTVSFKLFFFATLLFFLGLSLSKLLRFTKIIKDNYSSLERINLNWLFVFCILLFAFWAGALFLELFFVMRSWDLLWSGTCAIVFLIGNFGFSKPEIFSDTSDISPLTSALNTKKYQKSSLSPELSEQYLSKLDEIMKTKKLYLQGGLSLESLAQATGIGRHYLSQIINDTLATNFYEYINRIRIEEAMRRLASPEYADQTIAAIGLSIGFNSLSTFNACFKKQTGKTPSQYRAN